MADHLLDESDHEDPFASPSKKPAKEPERSKTPSNQNNRYDDSEDVREAVLQRELEGVRNINELIEGVVGTLERAKGNMHVSSRHSFYRPTHLAIILNYLLNIYIYIYVYTNTEKGSTELELVN